MLLFVCLYLGHLQRVILEYSLVDSVQVINFAWLFLIRFASDGLFFRHIYFNEWSALLQAFPDDHFI